MLSLVDRSAQLSHCSFVISRYFFGWQKLRCEALDEERLSHTLGCFGRAQCRANTSLLHLFSTRASRDQTRQRGGYASHRPGMEVYASNKRVNLAYTADTFKSVPWGERYLVQGSLEFLHRPLQVGVLLERADVLHTNNAEDITEREVRNQLSRVHQRFLPSLFCTVSVQGRIRSRASRQTQTRKEHNTRSHKKFHTDVLHMKLFVKSSRNSLPQFRYLLLQLAVLLLNYRKSRRLVLHE